MIHILFYGNCQLGAVYNTLKLSTDNYNVINIQCFTTTVDKEEFTRIIKKCDIIITQPIQDNYLGVDYLSTNYIINNANNNCKIIMFDSCYFNFYHFDLTYKSFNNCILKEPHDYHYNNMIECYKNNYSEEHYIANYVNNIDLKTYEELNIIAEDGLNQLKYRYDTNKELYNNEKVIVISIYEFVKNNYKSKLLFYSMNHPSKYVFHYICEQIINYTQIIAEIDYNADPLSCVKCILYKCIQKNVDFDTSNHIPTMPSASGVHNITNLYYATYKEINYHE
jgi:hypothetical protein